MDNVYISIGSNLGHRAFNCERAVEEMSGYANVRAVSSYYETDPVGVEEQPLFINSAVWVTTELSPYELLRKLHETERKLGRVRDKKRGPRLIDLDIIFYGNEIIDTPDLKIPHPEAHKRGFVLEPLNEIAPGLVHPLLGSTISKLLYNLNDSHKVVKLNARSTQNPQ